MPKPILDETSNNEETASTSNNNASTSEDNPRIIENNELLSNNNQNDNNYYSIINPAFVDDDTDEDIFCNNATCNNAGNTTDDPFQDWSWVQDFFIPDPEQIPDDARPPTPPPRSSSIPSESPKKEFTIVVHMVQTSPSKSLSKSTPNISLCSDIENQATNFNNEVFTFTPFDINYTDNNIISNESHTVNCTQNEEIPSNIENYSEVDPQNFVINQNITPYLITHETNPFYNNESIESSSQSIENDFTPSAPILDMNYFDLISLNRTENYGNAISLPLTTPPTQQINETEENVIRNVFPVPDLLSSISLNHHHQGVDDLSLRHHQTAQDKSINRVDTPSASLVGETSSVEMSTPQQTLPNDYQQLQTQSDDDEEIIDSGFIPRFVRASMRRVRRFRLSTRVSNARSEEVVAEDILNMTVSTTVESATIDMSTTMEDQEEEESRDVTDHDDSSDVSSTITDHNNESPPELPAPRQPASPRSRPDPAPSAAPSAAPSPLGTWPHPACFALAALGCTAGLFNLSRFAVLCAQFGGPFLVQFLILSLLFGVPLFLFHVALGHYLGSGVMDMWRISPVFQGVGIALLAGQALIGLYSIVGVSWLFIYFRDSFVTRQDSFKWAQPFPLYRGGDANGLVAPNSTSKLEETVPDYFSGVVLQRYNLSSPDKSFGHFKFQVAFNLAVVWMIVFVSLSKGLKSYGKVVFAFVALPVSGIFMLCCQMYTLAGKTGQSVFPETAWDEVITNNQCWIAAATETFMTWGMLGIATMQAASQVPARPEGGGKKILRDSLLVVLATLTVLLFVAFLADACTQLLLEHGFLYVHTSSFEQMSYAQFLKSVNEENAAGVMTPRMTLTRPMPHSSLLAGNRIILPGSASRNRGKSLSGYQALRLATELLPATFAAIGVPAISPFWAVLAFFTLILFGIAQQLAVWHSVITGIIAINSRSLKSWETTITFFTCAFGYILGLPLTTELGILVVYFLDTVVGSGWWLALLHCLLLVAVLVVRGRPYNGETVANSLFDPEDPALPRRCSLRAWLAPLLSFVWSVVLPIILLVLSVVLFRTSESSELYDWAITNNKLYWPVWARELGAILQLLPVLVVPLVAMVQTCRYLSNGPPDLFDRIELLYRPAPWGGRPRGSTGDLFASLAGEAAASAGAGAGSATSDDPPPKYTPPPSYTTATGARIAKLLRESIRRSMRRLAVPSTSGGGSNQQSSTSVDRLPPPPDYASVLVEMRRSSETRNIISAQEVAQILRSSFRRTREASQRPTSEISEVSHSSHTLPARSKTLTAPQVADILRSGSLRRSRRYTNAHQNNSTSNNLIDDNVNTINLNLDPSSSNI